MQNPVFKAPDFDEVANYPLVCRERFLGLTVRAQTASHGVFVHFLLPQIDAVLDEYLTWLAVYGD